MPLKFVKSRNISVEKIDDYTYIKSVEDDEVNDMIIDFMSEDAIDEEGNKRTVDGISSGDIIIRRMENHFQKIQDAIKKLTPEELHKLKEELPQEIKKFSNSTGISLTNLLDLNNIENYLGDVEVFTVIRRRVYNVYQVK